jgi:hypothetical protein
VNTRRSAVTIFNAHLGFAVRRKIVERLLEPHGHEFPGKTVGEPDGKRHEGRGLIAGESENRHLVPGENAFDRLIGQVPFIYLGPSVRRHLGEARYDAAGLCVKDPFVIADLAYDLSGDIGIIGTCRGREPRCDEDNGSGNGTLGYDIRIGSFCRT